MSLHRLMLRGLTLSLAFGGVVGLSEVAEARAVKSEIRAAALNKLAARDRLARIVLGRSLNNKEVKRTISSSDDKFQRQLLGHDDLQHAMNNRLHHFLAGSIQYTDKDPGFGGDKRGYGKVILGNPHQKLNGIIGDRIKRRHGGRACAPYNTATKCFAAWLVNRVAPELGTDWVGKKGSQLDDASYHRVVFLIMEAVPLPAY